MAEEPEKSPLRSGWRPRLSVMSLAPADVATGRLDAGALAAAVTDRYERRGRELWGLARRLGASDEEAHDAVQEAHLRLWRELGRGTVIEDLDAWTFRVLYRLVMDQHRVAPKVGEIVGRLRDRRSEVEHVEVDDRLSLWPFVDRLPARERRPCTSATASTCRSSRSATSWESSRGPRAPTPAEPSNASARTSAGQGSSNDDDADDH